MPNNHLHAPPLRSDRLTEDQRRALQHRAEECRKAGLIRAARQIERELERDD